MPNMREPTKPTPGPWFYRRYFADEECQALDTLAGEPVAGFLGGLEPNEADARLMAAAPELLSACIAALGKLIGYHSDGRGQSCVGCGTCTLDIPMLRAAIAKAERPMSRDGYIPYNGQVPRVAGSDTSRQAAESIEGSVDTMRARVLAFIRSSGLDGATDDEMEAEMGMRHQTVSARRRELVLKGLVRDSGSRRETRSGRKATVWEIIL